MKKLFLILLIAPVLGFGQIKTLQELKKISSVDAFERVCIENGFELFESMDTRNLIYVIGLVPNEFNLPTDTEYSANFWINREDIDVTGLWNFNYKKDLANYFDIIFDSAKKECTYIDITRLNNISFVTYDCIPNGKLGFARHSGGAGRITFIPYQQ